MTTAPHRPFASRLRAALLGLVLSVGALAAAQPADAATAVLAKTGTLYEVYPTTYGSIAETTDAALASQPVLALRVTPPGGKAETQIVSGTADKYDKFGESIEFEDLTQTVFVVYTRQQGFFSDVRVAIRRDGTWAEGSFLPNPGYYISLSPQLLVTRQTYTDVDAEGEPVLKSRSILSIVWWEETGASQARYAPVFIEDGSLSLDDVTAWNLNELNGAAGPTDHSGLPLSSYVHPGLQRDAGTNGGVLVSFANLATRTQQVLRIGFPDDYTNPATGTTTTAGRASNSRTSPIGRGGREFPIPTQIDLSFQTPVGTIISPAGVPTFYWSSGAGLSYLRGGSSTVLTIPFRPDFPVDRALAVVRDMSEKQ